MNDTSVLIDDVVYGLQWLHGRIPEEDLTWSELEAVLHGRLRWELHAIKARIKALPIPEQLRLAAKMLDAAAAERDGKKKLQATKTAHSIIERISTELGAALALHARGKL